VIDGLTGLPGARASLFRNLRPTVVSDLCFENVWKRNLRNRVQLRR
jgi:hypothetical protein